MNIGYTSFDRFQCHECGRWHEATLRRGDVFRCRCGARANVTATWNTGLALELIAPEPPSDS